MRVRIDTMLYLILMCLAAFVVHRLAEFEGRNGSLWGAGALVIGWLAADFFDIWWFAAPALMVVGAFAGLWLANLRDGDQGRKGRVMR